MVYESEIFSPRYKQIHYYHKKQIVFSKAKAMEFGQILVCLQQVRDLCSFTYFSTSKAHKTTKLYRPYNYQNTPTSLNPTSSLKHRLVPQYVMHHILEKNICVGF